MAKKRDRISTEGGASLDSDNPFAALSGRGLPSMPVSAQIPPVPSSQPKGPRPRLEVRRLKGGKGGKTVTEIQGFIGVNDQQLASLCKRLKSTCGVGGTVKGRVVEIQGDQREKIRELLESDGYRVVFAGG